MKKYFCLLALLMWSSCFPLLANKAYHDVTILVSSCDKYSALWPGFFELLYKYWPIDEQNGPKIVLIANHKQYKDARVHMVNIPHEISWSDNMRQALSEIKTEFVLFLLEDYYVTHFDHQRMQTILQLMREDPRVAYVQLFYQQMHGDAYRNHAGIFLKKKHDPYRTSLQASLWRTKDLLHLLKPGENPWQFEKIGSTRSEGMDKDFLIVMEKQPIHYLNMNHEGYLQSSQIEEARKLGITIQTSGLKIDKDYPWKFWLKRSFKPWLRSLKQKIKSIFA